LSTVLGLKDPITTMARTQTLTVINSVLAALSRGDATELARCLSPSARLNGVPAPAPTWLDTIVGRAQAAFTPLSVRPRDGRTELDVAVHREFGPGRPLRVGQEAWIVASDDERLVALDIDPKASVARDLPAPVAAFVRAVNDGDVEALLALFTADALINDQLREYGARSEQSEWARAEVLDVRLRLYAVRVRQLHGHAVLTARLDGSFDKRGMPDPLLANFYFTLRDERIVQLIILRTE
jgi:ketosteroid isomerase-like protein